MKKITPHLRFKLQIAADAIICKEWARPEDEGKSSRVLADEIVDLVLDTLEEKRPIPSGEELKPWKFFACKPS